MLIGDIGYAKLYNAYILSEFRTLTDLWVALHHYMALSGKPTFLYFVGGFRPQINEYSSQIHIRSKEHGGALWQSYGGEL